MILINTHLYTILGCTMEVAELIWLHVGKPNYITVFGECVHSIQYIKAFICNVFTWGLIQKELLCLIGYKVANRNIH